MQEKIEKGNKTKKEIIAISHREDLDGIGSAALLVKKFNDKIDIILSNYKNYERELKQVLKKDYKLIIIADLGFNEGLEVIIQALINSKAKIIWFDHHHLPTKYKNTLKDHVELVRSEDETVTAELINAYYFEDDKITTQIANLAHLSDNKMQDKTSDKLGLVIDGSQDSEEDLLKIVSLLLKGDFDNSWINQRYEQLQELYKSDYDKIIERVEEHHVGDIKILISWSDLVTASRISQYFMMIYNPDIAIGIQAKTRQVNIKSKKYIIRQICRAFHGGGHDHRAGFIYFKDPIENNRISRDLLDDIIEKIRIYLLKK